MAGKQPDWDQLLLRSEALVQKVRLDLFFLDDAVAERPKLAVHPGLPFVRPLQDAGRPFLERDILQVEQFSQRLRAKASRADPTGEALDASRLLAQEGLNPRK
jgi:hypothetical protein